jgi:phosphatidylserine/phosphatidylglycerophosphate/cardiolipin synthase-like enzyme
VPDTFGSVITGSSNFSEAGLINNLEFNVELKDYPDVKFALDKFEELWARGTDIRDTYIEAVEQNTWIRGDITPYHLYLKTLYEFFKEEINADKKDFDTANLSRKSKIKQNTPRYAAILGNIKGHF